MTSSKTTKRALLTSALAIVMCVAMLIGTTFAWFTDTASTAVNKIQAGNLAVKLQYSYDMENWYDADNTTKLFTENALWEPGYTDIVYLKVVNEGNLALKYSINFARNYYPASGTNVYGNKYFIGNYLMVGGVYTDAKFETREAAQSAISGTERAFTDGYIMDKEHVLKKGEASEPFAAVIYMPTSVGNEANAKPGTTPSNISKIGVDINATQATVESDSFNDLYDEAAPSVMNPIQYSGGNHEITENIQAYGNWGAVKVDSGTTTINADVYAVFKNDAAIAVWSSYFFNRGAAHVIINGGNYAQIGVPEGEDADLIYATEGGTIEINGGTFKASVPKCTLNVKDDARGSSKITVNGGRFYKFNPATDNPGEVFLGEGCTVTQDGDWFVVSK